MFWFFFKREIIEIMEIKEKWWNSKIIFFAYRKFLKKCAFSLIEQIKYIYQNKILFNEKVN